MIYHKCHLQSLPLLLIGYGSDNNIAPSRMGGAILGFSQVVLFYSEEAIS